MQELFIPVGFTFRPSDEQLLGYYLYNKVFGIPIPYVDYIVKECDLYGKYEPRQIWELNGGTQLNEDDDLYFFTKLKKKTPKSSRIDRKIGLGAWQGEDAPTEIPSNKSDIIIGSKKRFRYEKEGSEENGGWVLHEYTLHPSLLGENQSTNYVLCRIRKNQPAGTRRNKKSGLDKKRKFQHSQNNNRSMKPDRVFTNGENKQLDCMNNVKCQSSESSMLMMGQQEAGCNTDMTYEQNFQTREAAGMDCSGVAGAGQYGVPIGVVAPDESIQTLPMVQSAKPEKMMTQQQNQQPICVNNLDSCYEAALAMIRQKISSNNDQNFQGRKIGGLDSREFGEQLEHKLSEQDNEDDTFTGKCGKLFDKDSTGESVDWVSMPCMKEMLSDLPELQSEEYVFVPCDDGECAGNTSSSVDMRRNEQSLSDHGCVSEGILQRNESVSDAPMTFPCKTLVSEIPHHQPLPKENVVAPSESVDIGTMQYMSELPQLCELPQLPYEEIFVSSTDGEVTTRIGVDWATAMGEMP